MTTLNKQALLDIVSKTKNSITTRESINTSTQASQLIISPPLQLTQKIPEIIKSPLPQIGITGLILGGIILFIILKHK